jgi:hypothetical protein
MGSQTEEKEVLYSGGASPLFLAIEETEWRDALDIAEANPDQVRTWVRSTGTENTTFEWSMWRRLPIHEVSDCLKGISKNFYRRAYLILFFSGM